MGASHEACRGKTRNWGQKGVCNEAFRKWGVDIGGKSHHSSAMKTLTFDGHHQRGGVSILEHYDVAADAKKRISLRGAKTKYFHVKAFSNGCFVLEPRVLVPPHAISARALKMLDKSVAGLKQGQASAPIDLLAFAED